MLFINIYNRALREDVAFESAYSLLKQNIKTDFISVDASNEADLLKVNKEFLSSYSWICMNPNAFTIGVAYKICRAISEYNLELNVVMVGTFATLSSELIFRDCSRCDFVIHGDYEIPLLRLVVFNKIDSCCASRNQVADTFYVFDMGKYEIPARPILANGFIRKSPFVRIEGSRGCVGRCAFCTENYWWKGRKTRWRGRTVENIFAEIVQLYEKYKVRTFVFNDSTLEAPGRLGKQRLDELCDLLLSFSVQFVFCFSVRADSWDEKDVPLLMKMKEAGFVYVTIGMESLVQTDLDFYEKRVTLDQNQKCFNLFKRLGYYIDCGFININPLSTIQSIKENYRFATENLLFFDEFFFTRLSIEYGTTMYEKCKKLGVLKESYSYMNTYEFILIDYECNKIAEQLKTVTVNTHYGHYESAFREFFRCYMCFARLMNTPQKEEIYLRSLKPVLTKIMSEKFIFVKRIFEPLDKTKLVELIVEYDFLLQKLYTEVNKITYHYSKDRDFIMYLYSLEM